MVPDNTMQPIFVTVVERSLDAAFDRTRELTLEAGVELRVDGFDRAPSAGELVSFRQQVPHQLMYTRRSDGSPGASAGELLAALDAGFDYADVEIDPERPLVPDALRFHAARLILSHHDYESTPIDLDGIAARLGAAGKFKIAVTPRSLEDNLRLLTCQRRHAGQAAIFGMGAEGLYSRTMSPSFGGIVAFAAPSEHAIGAPGQLPVARMQAIVPPPLSPEPQRMFAIAGSPVAHSLSPQIHNAIFRSHGARAIYGYIDPGNFDEVIEAMRAKKEFAPDGISVTSPFKERAYELMSHAGADLSPHAVVSCAVNTILRRDDGGFAAANTDVDGMLLLLRSVRSVNDHRPVLIVGAGGTARAAAVAVRELSLTGFIANRTVETAEAVGRIAGFDPIELSAAGALDPSIVIDTLPASAGWSAYDLVRRAGATLISADYSVGRSELAALRSDGFRVLDGRDLLRAQAAPQSRMFLEACGIRLAGLPEIPEVAC